MNEIGSVLENRRIRYLTIDHRRCEHLDLCASALLDTVLLRARAKRRDEQNHLVLIGKLSNKSARVNTMLAAAGLPHRLKIPNFEIPEELKEVFKTFEMQEGTASHIFSSKQRNRCGTTLTDYFNDCLRTKGYELTEVAQNRIACLLTEVIGNAEEHGGAWHATGFWDGTESDDGIAGICNIVIFNSGTSIYESILRSDSSPSLREKLTALSVTHRKNFDNKWNEECLWTVYALQDQVSRFSGLPRGAGRGNGTVDMIEFFDSLAAPERKRMCIVSGGVSIIFDGRYHLSRGPDGLQTIAFNDSNDLGKPPNPKYVRVLEVPFSGTMVSIRLALDGQHLQKALNVIPAATGVSNGHP